MAISKVQIRRNGRLETLLDLTNDTVTEEALVEGYVAHSSDGEVVTGTNPYKKAETDNEVKTQEELIAEILAELEGNVSGGNAPSGYVVKTGTTTSATINTGLSSIKHFIIWKNGINETGLMFGSYDETSGVSYTYCSAWSTNQWGGTKTFATGTTTPTISDGTVTWRGSGTQGLSSGKTYNWLAIGE